jgi:peptide/nickel transport system permease protein
MTLLGMLRELLSTGPGKVGMAMLVVLVLLSVYSVVSLPPGFGSNKWSNPAAWADNPKSAPPIWANLLSGRQAMRHTRMSTRQPVEVNDDGPGDVRTYRVSLNFDADEPPTFITFAVTGVTYYDRPPILAVALARPDGTEVVLVRRVVSGPRPGETTPYQRYNQDALRIALTADSQIPPVLRDFFADAYAADLSLDQIRNDTVRAMVGVPDPASPDGFRLLHGTYQLSVRVTVGDPRDSVELVQFVAGGSLFGLMGTDSLGRDLAAGLLFGLPIALFIGVVASVTTTLIGTTLGVVSGYTGGKTDMVIQRLADITANVPLLPLLIFLVFIFGSHLLLIIFFLVAFSWPGLTIMVRSMVLQLRSGQLVESAVVLGASRWRIMYRYLFPHTAPFVFAQMIFFTPAAILAEAGLSFLGLGDPSVPTWGQILEQGFRTGAVFLGWWWWVIPPGVLIVITAVTFMLLALGLEPVVNPRLRRITPEGYTYREGRAVRTGR